MIIIVDGIDRVGKTTICEKLSKSLGYPISKDDTRYYGKHDNINVNTEKDNTFVNLIEQGCLTDIIFDRFHLTEYVYGKVERGYKNMYMYDIDERLAKRNDTVLILVQPVNVEECSILHGRNLSLHKIEFDKFFIDSKMQKCMCNMYTYDKVYDFIRRLIDVETK